MIDANTIQKYKNRSLGSLKKATQFYFNAYVRNRDSENGFFKCISCGEFKPTSKMHSGHYFNVGFHPSVRFDLNNAHGQCHKCNTYGHGNLIPYRENLIRKIGIKKFEQLEIMAHLKAEHSRIMLIHILEKYKPSK